MCSLGCDGRLKHSSQLPHIHPVMLAYLKPWPCTLCTALSCGKKEKWTLHWISQHKSINNTGHYKVSSCVLVCVYPHTFHTSAQNPSPGSDLRKSTGGWVKGFPLWLPLEAWKHSILSYCNLKKDPFLLVLVTLILLQHVKAGRHEILMWLPTCWWAHRAREQLQMADQHARNLLFQKCCLCIPRTNTLSCDSILTVV